MADAAIFYNNSISAMSDYAMYAEARLGSNGDAWGVSELVVGSDEEDATYSRIVWDDNLDNGFDTGDVSEILHTGTETVATTNSVDDEPITFQSSALGNIQKVQIRALALAAASVSWSQISITFYRGGVAMDSYIGGAAVSVDKRNATGPVKSEAILEVTPDRFDYDQVVISGSFRMIFDSTTVYPGATDLAGQFFVYTS